MDPELLQIIKSATATVSDLQKLSTYFKRGGDVNYADENGITLLQWAAFAGNLEVVALLISYEASVSLVSNTGYSPLHWAAFRGHIKVVKHLLSNTNIAIYETKTGFTPFLLAAMNGHTNVMSYFLEKDPKCINDTNEKEETALHLAVANNHLDAVLVLLESCIDLDARTETNGNTALHYALQNRNMTFVNLLLKKGADPYITNKAGHTAAAMAIMLNISISDNEISKPDFKARFKSLLSFIKPCDKKIPTGGGKTQELVPVLIGRSHKIERSYKEGKESSKNTKNAESVSGQILPRLKPAHSDSPNSLKYMSNPSGAKAKMSKKYRI